MKRVMNRALNRGAVVPGTDKSIRYSHAQISRQIQAMERAVLAFQPKVVGFSRGVAAIDTNLAIILSARLSAVWKRVGKTFPNR